MKLILKTVTIFGSLLILASFFVALLHGTYLIFSTFPLLPILVFISFVLAVLVD